MKRYKVSYFLSQAFKGMWRNRMMTVASVIVLLSGIVLVGCFSMLIININENLKLVGDLNELVAFANTNAPYKAEEKATLASEIKAENNNFLGWSTDPNAKAAEYVAGEEYSVDPQDSDCGNIVFYAIWENPAIIDEFKVKYSASGVSVEEPATEDNKIYKDGDKLNLGSLSSRISTVSFLGWSTDSNAKEPEFAPDSEYIVSKQDSKGGEIVFYAVWSEKPSFDEYSITYSSNGIEVSSVPTDVETRRIYIRKQLNKLDNISEDGIKFVSREETLDEEKKNLEDYPNLLEVLENSENPYPDSFIIKCEKGLEVSALETQVKNIKGIYKTSCRADIAETVENLKGGVIVVFSGFMVILLIISIVVIINTVKIALNARANEIVIMRYIGATKWFISLPFKLEGIIIGLLSGVLGFIVQLVVYSYTSNIIMKEIKMISLVPFEEMQGILFLGSIVLGAIMGFVGSVISIRKNLKA